MENSTKYPVGHIPVEAEQKRMLLSEISPDPKQPRHYYNETDMQELTDSVFWDGVLQPILLRPKNGGLMIVCGERRYRASLAVQMLNPARNTIPVTIRSLSDQEALRIQIIENLQRKDVQAMEEAVAFKSLLENGQSTIEDIAAMVGKSTKYVAMRMKLNDLITEFQEMLSSNKLSLGNAQLLCRASTETQIDTYNFRTKQFPQDWRENKHFLMKDFHQILTNATNSLVNAPFDITDSTFEHAPACTSCSFNTANKPLLFDDLSGDHCTKSACFHTKKQLSVNSKIEAAKVNQDAVLLIEGWEEPYGQDKKVVDDIKREGLPVFNRRDYTIISEPEPLLSFNEWADAEWVFDDTDEDLQEANTEYLEYVNANNKESDLYREALKSGEYREGIVVAGDNTGKSLFVKVKPEAISRLQATEGIPALEIQAIKDREVRAKELDNEKIYLKTIEELKTFYNDSVGDRQPELLEWKALCLVLYRISNHKTQKWFCTQLKLNDSANNSYYNMEVWEGIVKSCTTEIMSGLIRRTLLDTLISSTESDHTKYGKAAALHILAKLFIPDSISKIENEQRALAIERGKSVQAKISKLQKANK